MTEYKIIDLDDYVICDLNENENDYQKYKIDKKLIDNIKFTDLMSNTGYIDVNEIFNISIDENDNLVIGLENLIDLYQKIDTGKLFK